MRRIALFVLVAVAAAVTAFAMVSVGAAGAQPTPIGPNQTFTGFVNGSSGSAVIRMACFGPIRPGQTGHPFGGQTVDVTQSAAGPGFTGAATSIAARLFTSPSTPPTQLALFRFYDQPATIPASLSFPCAGTGHVVFRPVLGGPDARAPVVEVYFEGQP